jgi:hypothetical protein
MVTAIFADPDILCQDPLSYSVATNSSNKDLVEPEVMPLFFSVIATGFSLSAVNCTDNCSGVKFAGALEKKLFNNKLVLPDPDEKFIFSKVL